MSQLQETKLSAARLAHLLPALQRAVECGDGFIVSDFTAEPQTAQSNPCPHGDVTSSRGYRSAQEVADAGKREARRIELRNIFSYHAPTTSAQVVRSQKLRDAAYAFALVLDDVVPNGADKSAAIRLLRQAVMTANAAIALEGKA